MHAANIQDRDGAKLVLERLQQKFFRLRLIWADGAYAGGLIEWVKGLRVWRKLRLEIVSRPEGTKGFVLLPKRWVVERTLAWLGRCRRNSKDYERRTDSSESMRRSSAMHLMLKRLKPSNVYRPFRYRDAA